MKATVRASRRAEPAILLERRDEEVFWSAAHQSVRRLRADPVAWQEYRAELDSWDAVAGDGLADATDEWPAYQRADRR